MMRNVVGRFGVVVGLAVGIAGCDAEGSGFVVPTDASRIACGTDGGPACGGRDAGPPGRDGGPPGVDGGGGDAAAPACSEVTFTYVDGAARSVWVTGDWLAVTPGGPWPATPAMGAVPLVNDGAGTWSVNTRIALSGTRRYKFIVDETRWIDDPRNPVSEPDGFGGRNSLLDVCGGSCGVPTDFDWRDTVLYFAMMDRFRNGDPSNDSPVFGATDGDARTGSSGQYEGGDLAGVTEQIPYLAELGVTAVWLSAPYEGRDSAGPAIDPGADPRSYSAYHGYWPKPANISFADPLNPTPEPQVESRLGDAMDLHAFVDALHATTGANGHGMKVMFDYVMKHVDDESGLFGAHRDWFINPVRTCADGNVWDDAYWGTRCAFTNYLPSFDFYNAEARGWSVNDAAWWAREYDLDGYRLDAVKHIPLEWLMDLRARMTRDFDVTGRDRFYMVGETFTYDDYGTLGRFVNPNTMLDGQFDFPFKARACEALFTPGGRLDTFAGWMAENDARYGAGALMSTWIGNHDIPRAIHFASRQIGDCRAGSNAGNGWDPGSFRQPTDAAPYERLALAFVVMMTNPGVPLIYYGDEIGLAGGGDPDNRRMMPWEDEGATLLPPQRALRDTVTALGRIRGENAVLGRGRRETLSATQDTWVYRMAGCGAPSVVVAINRADGGQSVTIPDGSYDDLVSGGTVSGGALSLGPRAFRVLRAL